MERYGITLEDLHEQALLNMDVLQPYNFKGMSETIIEMMAGDIARDNGMGISHETIYKFIREDETGELPRLSTVLVSCQYPVLPASELFPLLSDPLFLYQQSF